MINANSVKSEKSLSFKISYKSFDLGYLKASQSINNNTHTLSLHGKAEGDLFFKKIISENTICSIFEKNELVASKALFIRNGKTLNNTLTKQLNGDYLIETIDQKNTFVKQTIDHTVLQMYFNEPKGVKYVYSEAWGKILPLNYESNYYSFKIPDGTECLFKYLNGVLSEVITKTIIGEIKITKI